MSFKSFQKLHQFLFNKPYFFIFNIGSKREMRVLVLELQDNTMKKVYMRSKVYPHDKNIPGPGSYKLPDKKGVQYSMRGRTKIQDSVHINVKNNIPGPGTYSSLTTFSPKGDNFVSTIR